MRQGFCFFFVFFSNGFSLFSGLLGGGNEEENLIGFCIFSVAMTVTQTEQVDIWANRGAVNVSGNLVVSFCVKLSLCAESDAVSSQL